ncbi:MAG: SpoVA/SpoVAEb family sporulation membrane protein [Firmicutes bacterium]|nr:SpoVA/SpoVAEb family sporulation membrane protein [Bacillota bacterium]
MDRDRDAIDGHKEYQRLVKQLAPKPNAAKEAARAFLVGGTLCLIGQFVLDFFRRTQPTEGEAIAATLATMILLGVVLTALGVYDTLGEFGGLGAAVPITGFANTIASAAMDFRREGYVVGMGAKMFLIAGPVIVFGIIAGTLTGLVAWLVSAVSG